MKKKQKFILSFILLFTFSIFAFSQKSLDFPQSKSELFLEQKALVSEKPLLIGIKISHSQGWYSYYPNSGAESQSLSISWNKPSWLKASQIEWAEPKKVSSTIENKKERNIYGYPDENYFFITLTPKKQILNNQKIKITAHLSWQICNKEGTACIPEERSISFVLPHKNKIKKENFFKEKVLPHRLPKINIETKITSKKVILSWENPDSYQKLKSAYFYPSDSWNDFNYQQKWKQKEKKTSLSIKRNQKEISSLNGILVLMNKKNQKQAYSIILKDLPSKTKSNKSFLTYLFFAFLGGIILNCMPCVFPVISLKILDFSSQAGQSRKKLLSHGGFFSAGILSSMWALALILVFLNQIGNQLGWGFQLQSPLFLGFIIFLLFALSLNLFGLFEFGLFLTNLENSSNLIEKKGGKSSFFSGLLTTLVATPCSGPFLGSVIGFALQQPALHLFIIFTFFGIGIAFPYLILCAFPQWLTKLPPPGKWMLTLKQFLGFPMLASALFFLRAYYSLVGSKGLFLILWGLLLFALVLWIYNRYCSYSNKKSTYFIGLILSIILSLGTLFLLAKSIKQSPQNFTQKTSSQDKWQKWTPQKLEALKKQKRIIWVDFTADWCITCQYNKKRLFSSPEAKSVENIIKKYNIALLRADWTRKNQSITKFLREKLQRSSVPVNVIYSPYSENPLILPEILSPKIVIKGIEKMANEKN